MFKIDKTRKHFIPKLYLRGFCLDDPPRQIYVFDKENPQPGVKVSSIENVEVSKDAYSVANDVILQEREDQWAGILNALKTLSVSELNKLIADREESAALRAWLARFVVDSKLRSRGFRQQMRDHVTETRLQLRRELESIEADSRAQFPDLAEQWQAISPLVKEMAGVDSDRKYEALHIHPFLRGEVGEKWYKWYEEGSWRFDEALEGRTFITSDVPSNSLLLGPEPEYRNWMWFIMPLSAKLQLTGKCGDARVESGLAQRRVEMSERDMDLANVCVFQHAERFVYASSASEILRASKQSAE